MSTDLYSILCRITRFAIPLPLLALSFAATDAYGQDGEVVTVPKVYYSYLPEGGGKREYVDVKTLSDQLFKLQSEYPQISYTTALTLEASNMEALRTLDDSEYIQILRRNPVTKPFADGIVHIDDEGETRGGGMSAAAAIEMLSVSEIGAAKCQELPNGPWEVYKTPILGRSSMSAVQFAKDVDTQEGLGRGQFDIRTTKFVVCRNQTSNDIEGIPINVRWVFNVNGNSLTTKIGNLTGPPPEESNYKQRFHAEGIGIQLVLMEIDGEALPPTNPIYLIVQDACIDIWFVEEVGGHDISVPASLPDFGVFCAGGYCKDHPPGLDATR